MANPYDEIVLQAQRPLQPLGQSNNGLDMDPETLATLLGTFGDQLELGESDKMQARADALRAGPGQMPEGRSSGRVYTAANPLEVLGSLGQQYAAKRMEDRAQRRGEKFRGRIGANVSRYGKELLGQRGLPDIPAVPNDLSALASLKPTPLE